MNGFSVSARLSRAQADSIFVAFEQKFRIFARPAYRTCELIHLPFYQFDIELQSGNQDEYKLAVDALEGLCLFIPQLIHAGGLERPQSVEFVVSERQAATIARKKMQEMPLTMRLRSDSIYRDARVKNPTPVYWPFWVGYFRKRKKYDFLMIDAISGEQQGMQFRRVFLHALRYLDRD